MLWYTGYILYLSFYLSSSLVWFSLSLHDDNILVFLWPLEEQQLEMSALASASSCDSCCFTKKPKSLCQMQI